MSSYGLVAAVLLACVFTFSAAQTSCKSRCGAEYYRGYMCQCDFSCLIYGECCKDYESQCTTKNSCRGRCGEAFKRGRLCSCDPDCVKYNQCCPDFKIHCDELEVNEEESVAAPVKPDCDDNVHNKPTEPSPEATEQPIGTPLTLSEGNDPGDNFIPTVNSVSYLQDDPSSASKQMFDEVEGPGSSPSPDSSGFGPTPSDPPEDLPTGPPLPDIDGFEIVPEIITIHPDTQTIASHQVTTAVSTSVPSTPQPTVDVDDQTVAPEPTVVNQTTSEPTSNSTNLQTGPIQPEENITGPIQPEENITGPIQPEEKITRTPSTELSQLTTMDSPITDSPNITEESTTTMFLLFTLPQSTETPTTVPTTTDEETEINAMVLPNISTLSGVEVVTEASTVATTNAEDTTTAEGMTTESPTSPAKPTSKPEKPFKPVPSRDHKPVLNGINGLDDPREYQADDSNDTDLCSGRPVSGVTTLSNGTVVVFRGHFFWVLDKNRVPGPARGITAVWGVPSPIDTIFTRCNCQGKTYIFKGPQYWRYENDVLDPGFPKVIKTGFDGLRGHITAALSVPQHNRRREAVYFFKRGGTVQRYSYQFGTYPSCGSQNALYTVRNRPARQVPAHVSLLEPAINIRTSWRGFPAAITAAVSIPNRSETEGYNYYVFTRSKLHRVRMEGESLVLADSKPSSPPQSNKFFDC